MIWIAVFIGGGLGSVCRFAIAHFLSRWVWMSFPFATVLTNAAASFILGYLTLYGSNHLSKELQAAWMIGFCGGFSTFSTFTAENAYLLQNGSYLSLSINILLSVVICLLFFFLGMKLAS